MRIDNDKVKLNIADRLKLFLKELKRTKLELTNEFSLNSFKFRTAEQITDIINQIDKYENPVLYVVSIKSPSQRKKLIEIYKTFHRENQTRTRGKDRINISRFNDSKSKILYLGSKMKNLRSRIKQHLGGGYFRTYGLQLNKWDSGLEYKLNLQIFNIKTNLLGYYQRNFIEMVEQELWNQFKPIFGKKSGL